MRKMAELQGQRFGRLTALCRLDEKVGTSYAWLCCCDCGREKKVSVSALLSGNTKSCGCGKTEALQKNAKDIKGMRFGRLLALEPTKRRLSGSVVWRCHCDCGKEIEVSYNSLVSKNTKSCGCLLMEHESPAKYMRYIDNTCVENLEFQGLRKNNTSGYTGVVAYRGKWRAQITFQKKRYILGTYENIEDAAQARKQAEQQMFGEFLEWYYSERPNESEHRTSKKRK